MKRPAQTRPPSPIAPGTKYTMTLKEMQAFYDYYPTECYQYNGEVYEVKNKRVCCGRYTVWLELKK